MLSFIAVLIGGIITASSPPGYYVAASGNDANPGTISQPWQTISKVNSSGIANGTSIFFNGGDTFTGTVQGTGLHNLTISNYGTGKAIFSCGDFAGVKLTNCENVAVSNLAFVGNGYSGTPGNITTTCTESAVLFIFTTPTTVYHNLSVANCTMTNCLDGVRFLNTNTSCTASGDTLTVTGCIMNHMVRTGVDFRGTGVSGDLPGTIYSNVLIAGNSVDDNPGYGLDGGAPWVTYNCATMEIRGNYSNNSGWGTTGNPVVFLLVNSTSPWVHHNELSNFTSFSGNDGHGIDPDNGCTNPLIEYNYCHDANRYGLYNFNSTGAVYRYNTVERCRGAYIFVQGSAKIYQNTFYSTDTHDVIAAGSSDEIYNNNIIGLSGQNLINAGSSTKAIGNTYGTTNNDGTFKVTMGGTTYTSLSSFRAAGFEKVSSTSYGSLGNPQFTAPGAGTQQLLANPVSHLSAYDIGSTSASRAAGADLTLFSIVPPITDWHGNPASLGPTPDAGAVAFGSH